MTELIVPHGYPLEEHFVTTTDGYILATYRIPHGKTPPRPPEAHAGPLRANPRPVLLQHGVLDSSATWVVNSPSKSLGFILADAGYDVWLGNSRGNVYARNHTSVDVASAAFWDFSMTEMATRDLPATVAHIQRTVLAESQARLSSIADGARETDDGSVTADLGPRGARGDGWTDEEEKEEEREEKEEGEEAEEEQGAALDLGTRGKGRGRGRPGARKGADTARGVRLGADDGAPTALDEGAAASPRRRPSALDRPARPSPPRIGYVGHSQGTAVALLGLAFSRELRASISAAALLAPVGSLAHIGSVPLQTLADLRAAELIARLGVEEFLPRSASGWIFADACRVAPWVCVSALTAFCGFSREHVDPSRVETYVQYTPSGTSVKNMAHWSQLVRRSEGDPAGGAHLYAYDYGDCLLPSPAPCSLLPVCNRCRYGVPDGSPPPEADVSSVGNGGTHLALFSGGLDLLADPEDVRSLASALNPAALVRDVVLPTYQHLDFVWGDTAAEDVYAGVIDFLEAHGGWESGVSAPAVAAKAAA